MFAFMEGCILDSRPDDKAASHDETFFFFFLNMNWLQS